MPSKPEPDDQSVDDFVPILKGIYEAGKTWPEVGGDAPFEISDLIITNPNEYKVLKSYRKSVEDHVNSMTEKIIEKNTKNN